MLYFMCNSNVVWNAYVKIYYIVYVNLRRNYLLACVIYGYLFVAVI